MEKEVNSTSGEATEELRTVVAREVVNEAVTIATNNVQLRSLDFNTRITPIFQGELENAKPISILKTPETPRDPRRKTVTFNDPVLMVLVSEPPSRSTSGDRSSLEVQPASSDVDRSSLPLLEQVLFP